MADYKEKIRKFYQDNPALRKQDENLLFSKYAGLETELWLELVTRYPWGFQLKEEVRQLALDGGKSYGTKELDDLFTRFAGNEIQLLRAVYRKYHLQNPTLLKAKLQNRSGKVFSDRQIKAFRGRELAVLQAVIQKYPGKTSGFDNLNKTSPTREISQPVPPVVTNTAAGTSTAPSFTPPPIPKPAVTTPVLTSNPTGVTTVQVNKAIETASVPYPVTQTKKPATGLIIGIVAGVWVLVLCLTGFIYRKEIGLLFASDAERMAHERIEQIGAQTSEGSTVQAKEFFDEDELMQLAQDSTLQAEKLSE
ncbi:MAG: hypothetical protein K1X82_08305 [Bacteroidia bacterium]|nr:hypothetical protein [Bacteroidia bacterium]